MLWTELSEASAKVRDHGYKDAPDDADWPVWVGSIPLRTIAGDPVQLPGQPADLPVPSLRAGLLQRPARG